MTQETGAPEWMQRKERGSMFWLRVMRWLLNVVIAILLIWFVFLAAERLFGV